MNLNRILIVGLGGFFGAALRYIISVSTQKCCAPFPVGTLIVNIAGGLLIGFILEAGSMWSMSDVTRIFLTTGLLGGLTTFSTFSYETVEFFSKGQYLLGGVNATANLILALLACWLGKMAVHLFR